VTIDPVREAARPAEPMAPTAYSVVHRRWETADTATLVLAPVAEALPVPAPGQFVMLWAFGVGEVPISTAGVTPESHLEHTIRAAGMATRALVGLEAGAVVGVRGPFGTGWDVERAEHGSLLVMAGGIGLAPLRPAVRAALEHRDAHDRVTVLVGARAPDELLYRDELAAWAARPDVDLEVTVDHVPGGAGAGWTGHVGLVTELLSQADLDPVGTTAFICGPEVMMRHAAQAVIDRGVSPGSVRLSTERNMRCAIGHCGHCQLGGTFVCLDGPVFDHPVLAPLLAVRER
jgi:NAD(P)H-flavin reductase